MTYFTDKEKELIAKIKNINSKEGNPVMEYLLLSQLNLDKEAVLKAIKKCKILCTCNHLCFREMVATEDLIKELGLSEEKT